MKKLILAALATTLGTAPVLAQPFGGHDNRGRIEQRHDDRRDNRFDARRDDRGPQRIEQRRWNKGERFDSRYARNYRVIGSPRAYHLRDAPRGYRWVQSGSDAVLVGITTGIVAAVMADLIR